MTFDELIAQGIRATLDERCAEYRTEGKKHRFSIAYKILREIIIRFRVKKVPSVKSINIILTTLISVLLALLGFGIFKGFLKEKSK